MYFGLMEWILMQADVENLSMEERRLDDRIRYVWLIYF